MAVFTVILTIGLVFFMNTGFLEDFYLSEKENALVNVFNNLETASSEDILYSNEYRVEFSNMSERENISCMIMRPNGTVLVSSESSNQRMIDHLLFIAFRGAGNTVTATNTYTIRMYTDSEGLRDYLVLWGNLSDGNTVFMETAMESIRDSVSITNRFLLVAGVIAIIAGIIFAFGITSGVLKPLSQLTELSERMSELDFDAKFIPKSIPDEVDILGIRMNQMSSMIEQNIKELKQKNIELKADIRLKEQNEEMRREFISNVSHELKTPISLIMGYADGLLEEEISDSPERRRHYAEIISDEAGRMDSMIATLLNLNEIEYGRINIQMARISLTNLVKDEIESVLVLAENAGVKIEDNISDNYYVWADENLTHQVIENYLTNAIRYAENEKIARVNIESTEDNRIRFSVFNTGNGIPKEEFTKIWDKFYKIDPARTRELNSTGIGLSVVKAAAESMGYEYGLMNVEGGVLFYFIFDSNFS